jgi:hypothetical protein
MALLDNLLAQSFILRAFPSAEGISLDDSVQLK